MQVDLVVLDTNPPSYLQELNTRITNAVVDSAEAGVLDQPGGVFVRRAATMTPETLLMLRVTARVHVPCDGRSIGNIVDMPVGEGEEDTPAAPPLRWSERSTPQVVRAIQRMTARIRDQLPKTNPAAAEPARGPAPAVARPRDPSPAPSLPPLALDNGIGGLTADDDYEIRLHDDLVPPAPWVNVVANPVAGFVVSERGAGVTWAENSYFYRLTPWHNDPVSDPASDVLYLRDEETGELWSATPAPIRHDTPYTIRHGAGTSTFTHEHAGIATE
jgi:cyclic beta-1,2-glucan synthetase